MPQPGSSSSTLLKPQETAPNRAPASSGNMGKRAIMKRELEDVETHVLSDCSQSSVQQEVGEADRRAR